MRVSTPTTLDYLSYDRSGWYCQGGAWHRSTACTRVTHRTWSHPGQDDQPYGLRLARTSTWDRNS